MSLIHRCWFEQKHAHTHTPCNGNTVTTKAQNYILGVYMLLLICFEPEKHHDSVIYYLPWTWSFHIGSQCSDEHNDQKKNN